MNHEQIESLVAVLRESPRLTEVEVRQGSKTLRLRRAPVTAGGKRIVAHSAHPAKASAINVAEENAALFSTTSADGMGEVHSSTGTKTEIVTAEVVGIFRRAKGGMPASGDTVSAGKILGQIEAMRLMNEITAPASGTIQAILVQEGQPVEYGQPLFEIIPEEA